MQKTGYYHHIDGIRAIAVIAVIFHHLGFSFAKGGFVGVDIFFVVSGYLITAIITKEITQTGNFSFINFYFRRAKRIFPALIATLIICLVFAVWLLLPNSFILFAGTLTAAASFVANHFLYKQTGYFDDESQNNPLLHTWSLGVEEQFYIFWPIILLLSFKLLKEKSFLFCAVILIGTISFYWNFYPINHKSAALYYLTIYRAFEFCIGASLYLWRTSSTSKLMHEIICFLGIIFICYAIFFFDSDMVFPSYNALIPTVGAALLITFAQPHGGGVISQILTNRITTFIGLISYSLYLVHWPLIVFTRIYNKNTLGTNDLNITQTVGIIVLSLIFAYLMYVCIEQPFRRINVTEIKQKKRLLACSGLSLACCFVLGIILYKSDGLMQRVNILSQNINDNDWAGAGFKDGYIYQSQNKSSHKIIMLGDSSSRMLNLGILEEIARPLDISVFTISYASESTEQASSGKYQSSLLLPNVTRIGANKQQLYDLSSKNAQLELLENLTNDKNELVIYNAHYLYQLPTAGNLSSHQKWQINPTKSINYNDYQPLIDGLEQLRMLLAGRKLIIIGNIPKRIDDVKCDYRLKWFANLCQAKPLTNNPAALNINKVLKQYAQKHESVYFINPYDVLCDANFCYEYDSVGNSIYADNRHFSKAGSRYFIQTIKDKLINIMINNR